MIASGLQGKVALVTGGGTGIGAAIALRLAGLGARVCVAGRRLEPLERTVATLPAGSGVARVGDVSREADVRAMVAAAAALGETGAVDILVNNAAAPVNGTVESVSLEDWRTALDVNLTGAMLTTRCVVGAMRVAGGGAIVNVASVAALTGNPGITPYATSKAALVALTKQCAVDFGPDGVRVNAICPGWVRTEMSERQMDGLATVVGGGREEAFAAATHHQPLARVGRPDEIADAVAFLAGDGAAYITGAVLPVDGGSSVVGPLAELLR